MSKPTLSDFIAKSNKNIPFEERAAKFERAIKPICEELGVVPWAVLHQTPDALIAIPNLKDIFLSNEPTQTNK